MRCQLVESGCLFEDTLEEVRFVAGFLRYLSECVQLDKRGVRARLESGPKQNTAHGHEEEEEEGEEAGGEAAATVAAPLTCANATGGFGLLLPLHCGHNAPYGDAEKAVLAAHLEAVVDSWRETSTCSGTNPPGSLSDGAV